MSSWYHHSFFFIFSFSFLSFLIRGRRGCRPSTESTCAPEAASAADALLELLNLDNLGGVDALNDELRDAVALLDLEVGVGMVEEQNLDGAAVVGVDHAGARVDEVLGCQTRARRDAAVLFRGRSRLSMILLLARKKKK